MKLQKRWGFLFFCLGIIFIQNYIVAGFAVGTLVKTPSGCIKIEDLSIGDSVYCCIGQHSNSIAHKYFMIESKTICIVTNCESIFVSTNQRFYCASEMTWKKANSIRPGDHLFTSDGSSIEVIKLMLLMQKRAF